MGLFTKNAANLRKISAAIVEKKTQGNSVCGNSLKHDIFTWTVSLILGK